jgi:uncharacterized protein (TIGR00297 family)
MENQWIALALSFGFILITLGVTTVSTKIWTIPPDISRKMIHIGVSNWIVLAMYLFKSLPFLLVTPIAFIIINYLSYRFELIQVMEQKDDSFGTVWYAISLTILCLFAFILNQKEIAIIGILIMGYGDGMAALIGKYFGKKHWVAPYQKKTYLGSFIMFILSFLVTLIALYLFYHRLEWVIAMIVGIVATLVELIQEKGRDNLFVPLISSFLVWFFLSINFPMEFKGVLIGTIIILGFAVCKQSITLPASIHAFFVAAFLYQWGGRLVYFSLIAFFICGSVLSKVGARKQKGEIEEKIHARIGARTTAQVYANAGSALIMVMLGRLTSWPYFMHASVIVFIAAMADTASSEIGILSNGNPISIVTWKQVQKGISGGISVLGLVTAFAFSVLFSFFLLPKGPIIMILAIVFGFLGSIVDSYLGALLQAKYYNEEEDYLTEKKSLEDKALPLVAGIRFITNDGVNFLSTLFVSTSYVVCCLIFSL